MHSPHPSRIKHGLVVPPPLMMDNPGSFAYHTWRSRWRSIVQGVSTDQRYGLATRQHLDALLTEMYTGTVLTCPDTEGDDLSAWTVDLEPYSDRPWRDVPWFFAEVYFYRRLLAATQYFHPGSSGHLDPFEPSKASSLMDHLPAVYSLVAEFIAYQTEDRVHGLRQGWSWMLWGNQADLSLQPGEHLDMAAFASRHAPTLLIDERDRAIAHICARSPLKRIDIIADNAGIELVCDLAWLDFMLTSGLTQTAHLHLKAHPTFVSDATPTDLQFILNTLTSRSSTTVQGLGLRLQRAIASSTLQVHADPFWTAPRVFWEMPEPLYQELATSDLLVFKGDANYRRIVGDRQWDTTASFAEIASYLPAPALALRTLKSELVVGLAPGQAEAIARQDPNWQVNGQWSVMQYLDGKPEIASQ